MCFSAEASFTVGSILTVIGTATFIRVKERSLKLVALIPLIFAIQQLAEGLVWLQINGVLASGQIAHAAMLIYLFFAWVVWPFYVPLALLVPETVRWKQLFFFSCFLIGSYIAYVDMAYLLYEETTAKVVGRSLYYGGTPTYGNIAYGIAAIIPFLLSSVKDLWIFGVWLLGAFLISQLIYATTFTSVWCFFAAAVSLVLYRVLVIRRTRACAAGKEKKVNS